MRPRAHLSAAQTATLAGLGGLLSASGFILPFGRHLHRMPGSLLLVFTLTLIAIGFAVSLFAESNLKEGILHERWNPDKIVSLRAILASSLWTGTTFLCVIASGITIFALPRYKNVGWALLLSGQAIVRLQTAVKLPLSKSSSLPDSPAWQDFRPIRSDHWGGR